ncbi:O-antigen ligase family protein [Isoptericola sp. NEAU-Y5]|uniref:O-antigen ligase family protein n=1 Tax=Isoptericola luteus TaxID=2879484 RepID=A0ABS7ZH20_9MICO|nr:O-antigen ligase family protein [Isoptericola sp. NEAU-Y5]MCA5892899.1 O-antigen ligase family protein [Isoptericola sp. NEAU-Y5]
MVGVAGLLLALGAASVVDSRSATIAALALFGAGLLIYDPMSVPVIAMPVSIVVERVGAGSIDLTISDVVLFAAFWVALLFAPRPFSRPMRAMLWLNAFYQAATLFTVVANPYQANTVEWFHAWLLVGGALVVGWAVGRSGRARIGMSLFLAACAVLALSTCLDWLMAAAQGDFGPVYPQFPFPMHKNFVGDVVAFAAVVAYARPSWLGWHRRWALSTFWLCSLAVLASQSRQALIGLAGALVLLALRPEPGRKRSLTILLAIIPAVVFVGTMVSEQLESDNRFNSAHQRLTWYEQALTVWNQNPAVGVGLRWWTAGRTEYGFQPPNAELEILTSAGTVGLIGFLTMVVGMTIVLWRMDRRYGTLAVALLGSRLAQGQFDLFWVSIQVSVPFLLIGVCLGAQAFQASQEAADPPPDAEALASGGTAPGGTAPEAPGSAHSSVGVRA